jgi:hypothetical protein
MPPRLPLWFRYPQTIAGRWPSWYVEEKRQELRRALLQLAASEPPAPKRREPGRHLRRIAWLVLSERAAMQTGKPLSHGVKNAYSRAEKHYDGRLTATELELLRLPDPPAGDGKAIVPRQYSDAWQRARRHLTVLFDPKKPDELAVKLALDHVQMAILKYLHSKP